MTGPEPVARVLLLATTRSYRAGAFLDAARRMGIAVTVAAEKTPALASFHRAGHLTLDFLDVERGASGVAAFAAEHPLAAVIAADDDGVQLAAAVASRLGLRFHAPAAVAIARDKLRMREALERAGVPGPAFQVLPHDADPRELARSIRYPAVVKPRSLGASRGVLRVDDPSELVAACERVRRIVTDSEGGAPELLVEEFMPGDEVAVEGLVGEGRLRILAIFDKCDPLDGPTFEETIYVTPSRHPAAVVAAIERAVARLVGALGLDEGPVHAEFRIHQGECRPLEIAPRPIGGLCSRSLRFGNGRSLEELILRHALRLEGAGDERERLASGVLMIPIPRAGVLRAVHGVSAAAAVAGVEDIRITIPIGDELVPLPEGARYLGFVFARHQEPAAVEAALRAAHGRLEFDVTPAGMEARPIGDAGTRAIKEQP